VDSLAACTPAGGEKANRVCHVSTTDEQSSTIAATAIGATNYLGNPANGLNFDFRGYGRGNPCRNIWIGGGGEKVTQHAYGGGSADNASPALRMADTHATENQRRRSLSSAAGSAPFSGNSSVGSRREPRQESDYARP
jgi:hypothetical protein